ncbi:antitermination protein [Roseibium litorale]|uniref:Antitermination protein n=1 Tax=Roseibium litorale TaxID=2803841 RepID=A0ABR9CHQ2_9HYPH|nr:antitermination protein [Roseibium litorale]MBD8890359.1 antitermination protein [Roseibium litorale]
MKLVTLGSMCLGAAAAIALVGQGLVPGLLDRPAGGGDLTRTDCARITVFAPSGPKTAEDLCRPYGGLALKNAAPSDEGLVILVRNQPMGGFRANTEIR